MSSVRTCADSPPAESDVVAQLEKIVSSAPFRKSPRSAEFLRFVVHETLAGRSDFIKARSIAIAVFGRNPDDNPEDDPIVRIRAGRVRGRLEQYYEEQGANDPVRILLSPGSYVPTFHAISVDRSGEEASRERVTLEQRKDRPRIAVLQLVSLGGSPEYHIFADGLGERLSVQLARFQGLAVLDYWTTSQLQTAQQDMHNIDKNLAIDFLIRGSVARSGDRVRISIQCVHVDTMEQIWAQPFDRKLTVENLFEIQDEIVDQVVACVGDIYGSIPRSLYRASRGKPILQLTAYEAVLATHHYVRCLDRQTHVHTRAALEHAVDVEPTYELAWAILGALYCDIHAYGLSSLNGPLVRAEACVQRAMTLDPECQHAHYASAYVGALTRDHPRVIAACENILRLNPSAAFMVGAASIWLGIAGRFDQALPLLEQSLELNPYHPGWFHFLPWLHAFTEKDYERALSAAHRFNMPEFLWDPLIRAACLAKLGKEKEAAIAYQDVLKLCPDFAEKPGHYVGCYVHFDDTRNELLDSLSIAGMR